MSATWIPVQWPHKFINLLDTNDFHAPTPHPQPYNKANYSEATLYWVTSNQSPEITVGENSIY